MNNIQFIIFITIFIFFLVFIGYTILGFYVKYANKQFCPAINCPNITAKKSKKKPKKRIAKIDEGSTIENFEGNIIDKAIYESTMPNPNLDQNIQNPPNENKNWQAIALKMAKPLPDDDIILTDLEREYNNPFHPSKENVKVKQNYPNPEDMTSVERNAFKFGYPNGMAMQDYVNWIYLFKQTPNLLNMEHYYNYEKLLVNVPIKYEKGKVPPPAKRLTPLNAEDYFVQMYTSLPERQVPSLTKMINEDVRVASNQGTSGIMAANYIDYGDFAQNFGVKGTTGHVYNPELADKTDPYFLQNIVGPNWDKKGEIIPQISLDN